MSPQRNTIFTLRILTLALFTSFVSSGNVYKTETGDKVQRILHGYKTWVRSYPYAAYIKREEKGTVYTCGGAIISEYNILTAAHCVSSKTPVTVVTGTSFPKMERGTEHEVQYITYPSERRGRKNEHDYDLAVLTLFDKIIFDDYQQPIPLATSNVVEKQKAIISGWGVTEKGVVEDQLKVAEFTVQRFCKDRADKFCVKGSSSDGICRGDSGSPVMINDKLAGIVSVIYTQTGKCYFNGVSGITNVYLHADFINEVVDYYKDKDEVKER